MGSHMKEAESTAGNVPQGAGLGRALTGACCRRFGVDSLNAAQAWPGPGEAPRCPLEDTQTGVVPLASGTMTRVAHLQAEFRWRFCLNVSSPPQPAVFDAVYTTAAATAPAQTGSAHTPTPHPT